MTGKFARRRASRASSLPYRTLSLDEIGTFPVQSLLERGGHCYLWTTNKFIQAAFDLFEMWDVRFHLMMVMVKPSGIAPACGYVFGTEFVLLGFNGRPMQDFCSIGKLNWFKSCCVAGRHSVKPETFYSLVRTMSPGPRLDCFARRRHFGFAAWGDELE
jgi:N6-adenosine-specific RNA methylase IME4